MSPNHAEFIMYYQRWLAVEDKLPDCPLETKGDCARAFNKEVEATKETLGSKWEPDTMADLDRQTINLNQAQNIPWRVLAARMKYLLENY